MLLLSDARNGQGSGSPVLPENWKFDLPRHSYSLVPLEKSEDIDVQPTRGLKDHNIQFNFLDVTAEKRVRGSVLGVEILGAVELVK
jgi:hypothetical protein